LHNVRFGFAPLRNTSATPWEDLTITGLAIVCLVFFDRKESVSMCRHRTQAPQQQLITSNVFS
jgi:hypothetical protein